jgi:hypothetical protein
MIYIVIIRGVEVEFDHLADAMRVSVIYGEIVYFRTHKDGILFEL